VKERERRSKAARALIAASLSGSNRSATDNGDKERAGSRGIDLFMSDEETDPLLLRRYPPWSEAAVARGVYWQRDKYRAAFSGGSGQETAHPRRRRVGEIYRRVLFFISFSLFFSLPRASARHSLRGKPPAEMRRAATREWNIIA